MKENVTGTSNEGWKPGLAESFEAEFMSSEGQNRIRGMSEMGFSYRGSRLDGECVVSIGERQNGDGTTIEIRIKKGKDYKSPKELMDEEMAKSLEGKS